MLKAFSRGQRSEPFLNFIGSRAEDYLLALENSRDSHMVKFSPAGEILKVTDTSVCYRRSVYFPLLRWDNKYQWKENEIAPAHQGQIRHLGFGT